MLFRPMPITEPSSPLTLRHIRRAGTRNIQHGLPATVWRRGAGPAPDIPPTEVIRPPERTGPAHRAGPAASPLLPPGHSGLSTLIVITTRPRVALGQVSLT